MSSAEAIVIRRLGDDEVDVVGDVLGLARLYQGDGFYLVAWIGGQPAGHLHLALTEPAELQDVQVRPDARRRGVASALVAAAEAEAISRGLDRLRLTVGTGNRDAQAFYASMGYADSRLPPKRVHGTIMIRTGPIEVDDTLLTFEKALPRTP